MTENPEILLRKLVYYTFFTVGGIALSVFPPTAAPLAGVVISTTLSMVSGLLGSTIDQTWDSIGKFFEDKEKGNHLNEVVGKAITNLIQEYQKETNHTSSWRDKEDLKRLIAQTQEWDKFIQERNSQIFRSQPSLGNQKQVTPQEINNLLKSNDITDVHLFVTSLIQISSQDWKNILDFLSPSFPKKSWLIKLSNPKRDELFNKRDELFNKLSQKLHHKFPEALRKVIIENAESSRKVYAEISLSLLENNNKEIRLQRQDILNISQQLGITEDNLQEGLMIICQDLKEIKQGNQSVALQFFQWVKTLENTLEEIKKTGDKTLETVAEIGTGVEKTNEKLDQGFRQVSSQLEDIINVFLSPSSQINENDLYKTLIKLNFNNQYETVANSQLMASFLISGEKEYGVEIFLKRLCDQKNLRVIKNNLDSNQEKNSKIIWEQIASELGLNKSASLDNVWSRIIEAQKEQNLIFIVKSVNKLLPGELSDLLVDFWQPLCSELAKKTPNTLPKNKLLLFLVDYENIYRNTPNIRVSHQLFTPCFTKEDLEEWIKIAKKELGTNFPVKLDNTQIRYILEESKGGIPRDVYRTLILEYFNPNYWAKSEIRDLVTSKTHPGDD